MATTGNHLLHLIAWAQIGVLVRAYLGALFGGACAASEPWVPCVTSSGSARYGGAVFNDLPANILGSFLMGVFVSSDVLSNSLKHTLTVEAPLAMLPVGSPLQTHLPFQVGLRTGLCGSLTTFASWVTQMVVMMVGGQPMPHGTEWVAALSGLLIGTLCAMGALVMGQHVALLIYHKLNPGAFIPYGSPAIEQLKTENKTTRKTSSRQPSKARISSKVSIQTVSSTTQGNVTMVVVQEPSANTAAAADGSAMDGTSIVTDAARVGSVLASTRWQSANCTFAGEQIATATPGSRASLTADRSANDTAGADSNKPAVFTEVDEEAGPVALQPSRLLVDGFAVVVICVLTAASLWRIINGSLQQLRDSNAPFAAQWFWWAILFGPVGCYIRYYLSRYNSRLHGGWKWFPVGTFTANVTACVLDYVMMVLTIRLPGMGDLQLAVLNGVTGGVGGCLSTVSTWVVEVQRLLLSYPNTSHGYEYIFISIVTSVVLGLMIYGIPVWTLG